MASLLRTLRRDESGIAMFIAIILSAVVATIVVTTLSVASHSDNATARARAFVQALHVAESGVEQGISKVQATNGTFSGTFGGSTDEGSYRVTVTKQPRNTYLIDSTGGVRSSYDGTRWVDRRLGAHRRLQVTLAPPKTFRAALFSFTSVVTKNNDEITGDIWANQNAILTQGTILHGGVTGATGYVIAENGSVIDGDVVSGGFDPATSYAIHLSTNVMVGGGVTASVTNPPDPITCGGASNANYEIRMDGGAVIKGNATTWGTRTGPGTVQGTTDNNKCTASPATIPMPVYTYSAANYDPITLHEYGTPSTPSPTALSDFQNYLVSTGNKISGTFYLNQALPVNQDVRIDLTKTVVTGDTTIVTNTPIFTNGTTDDPAVDKVVLLASFYKPPVGTVCDVNQDDSDCAIHLKNNFATSGATAVLVYSPYGPTAVKNNALQDGAVYADSIEIKNNQILEFDPRIERFAGFGPVTLEIAEWLELSAG